MWEPHKMRPTEHFRWRIKEGKKKKKEEKKRYGEDINAIGYINMYLHVVRGDTTRHPCLAVTMMRPPTRTYCTPASSCIASKH